MFYTQDMDRQKLKKLENHLKNPYSCELGKQAYIAACRGSWWISSSMHISFTRLDLKQESTMDKGMQQILFSGEPRNLLPTFHPASNCSR